LLFSEMQINRGTFLQSHTLETRDKPWWKLLSFLRSTLYWLPHHSRLVLILLENPRNIPA